MHRNRLTLTSKQYMEILFIVIHGIRSYGISMLHLRQPFLCYCHFMAYSLGCINYLCNYYIMGSHIYPYITHMIALSEDD
ncbi:hypothetical protein D3C78_1066600 [compost metagenome]